MRSIKIIQPVLIVLVVHVIFTVFLLQYYQQDISCLVHAGQTFTISSELPKELCLKDQGDGYDGQFNYRFAVEPFSNQATVHGITIDLPIYRYQRILYPLLTWGLTGGNRTLVPIVFVLINLISICALTALSAKYALDLGHSSYWGLTLGLYLGFLLSYALDLGHTLEVLLLFAALLLIRKKDGWAVILLICAVLTRETALCVAVAVVMVAFFQRWQRWYLYLAPLLAFALWQVFLLWFWKDVPNLVVGYSPFSLMTGFITAWINSWQSGDFFGLFLLIFILAFGVLTLVLLRASTAPLYVKLAWLFYSALALLMPYDVWAKFNGYLRSLSEWYFLGFLIILPAIKFPALRSALNKKSGRLVNQSTRS